MLNLKLTTSLSNLDSYASYLGLNKLLFYYWFCETALEFSARSSLTKL